MEEQIQTSKSPLILGIVSLFTWFIPIIGIVTSIVGIVLSVKNLKMRKYTAYKVALGLNIAGLVLTVINAIAGVLVYL